MTKFHIIDDDIDLCDIYRDLLELEGNEVMVDYSVSQAITTLAQFTPDIVLLDMHLSGESGEAVLSYIRRQPELKHCQVITVSGDPSPHATSSSDFYLQKPVSLHHLRDCIRQCLL